MHLHAAADNLPTSSKADAGANEASGGRFQAKLRYYTTIMSNGRVGTSGWHYPTGPGRWDGVFYPARRGRGTTFDELAYYAEPFDTAEVNSTFYGQPPP